MKPISTKLHGVLDYSTGATLIALPRLLKWSESTTKLLTVAGAGTLIYSVFTRYELGVIKVLPMRLHLLLDALSGATLCAAPWTIASDAEPGEKKALVALGLFEIAASLLTQTQPSADLER